MISFQNSCKKFRFYRSNYFILSFNFWQFFIGKSSKRFNK